MAITLPASGAAPTASLNALVEKYGVLPLSFVKFLSVHDGAKPPSNVLEGTNHRVSVVQFLISSEIIETSKSVEGFPANLLPFGDDDSGNFICIGVGDHRIYFWDHELDNCELIAQSFDDFLNRLEYFDISSVRLKPGQAKRVWTNSDFKPDF